MESTSLHRTIDGCCALAALAIATLPPAVLALAGIGAAPTLLAVALLAAAVGAAVGLRLRRDARGRVDAATRAQQAENLRFHTAMENISQGLCFFDGQQRLIVCNQRYAQMYRLSAEQVRPGTTLQQIVEYRVAAGTCPAMTPEAYLKWRNQVAVSDKPSDTVAHLVDGRIFAIHHEPMPDRGWVATHEDVTDRRRAQDRIEQLARSDALTGLANRVEFRERLDLLLSRAPTDERVAVLFIDLDRFKAVNDTLGHPVGDRLLRAVALRLSACVRQGDLVARLGGDEFAIVQCSAHPAAARSLAERLVRDVSQPYEVDGHTVQVGASVGVAFSPDDSREPDDLLVKADLALYAAKAAGRGTARFFDDRMVEQARGRRALELDLRHAIERGELELHYQPIFALDATPPRIAGCEALLRWRHPQRGLVAPDSFIPLAEEVGLIDEIGAWVVDTAVAEALHWPAHIGLAINLSPLQLDSRRLVDTVAERLAASGLAPARVEFEVTETVRLDEGGPHRLQLQALRELGVRIALDDFGVGFASLSYLRSFAFQRLKIDRSFVRDLAHSAEAVAIVRSVVALGAELGLAVTAEGVEQAVQLDRLASLGCQFAQGYHLARPMPAAALRRLLGTAVASDAMAMAG